MAMIYAATNQKNTHTHTETNKRALNEFRKRKVEYMKRVVFS